MLAHWTVGLDAATRARAAMAQDWLGPDHADPSRRDALAFDDWAELTPAGSVVWLNPPYTPADYLSAFLARACATAEAGMSVVGLLPAATGTTWWWSYVQQRAQVQFLPGRLRYEGPHEAAGGTPRWASALVLWKGSNADAYEPRLDLALPPPNQR